MVNDRMLRMVELEKMFECTGSFVGVRFDLVGRNGWDGECVLGFGGGAEEAGDGERIWEGGEGGEHRYRRVMSLVDVIDFQSRL